MFGFVAAAPLRLPLCHFTVSKAMSLLCPFICYLQYLIVLICFVLSLWFVLVCLLFQYLIVMSYCSSMALILVSLEPGFLFPGWDFGHCWMWNMLVFCLCFDPSYGFNDFLIQINTVHHMFCTHFLPYLTACCLPIAWRKKILALFGCSVPWVSMSSFCFRSLFVLP